MPYSGVFDGGGNALSNLPIRAAADRYGVGLFGSASGTVRNLRLKNVTITGGRGDVGTLAGYGRGLVADNVSVEEANIMSPNAASVGGLVGDGVSAEILFSSATGGSVRGDSRVGGLVGDGANTEILFSSVTGGSVLGNDTGWRPAGGGCGRFGDSFVVFYRGSGVRATGLLGGLLGFGARTAITFSYVADANVHVAPRTVIGRLGGLGGEGQGVQVVAASYASGVNVFA